MSIGEIKLNTMEELLKWVKQKEQDAIKLRAEWEISGNKEMEYLKLGEVNAFSKVMQWIELNNTNNQTNDTSRKNS